MTNRSPLSQIDPDENYFNKFCNSVENSSKYYSCAQYRDLFRNFHYKISLINYNIRSFSANSSIFFSLLESLGSYPDIIILTETWFTNEYKFEIPKYDGYHVVRSEKRSGGVSVYVSKSIESKILPEMTTVNDHIEICSVKIKLGRDWWYLFNIYRPHSGTILEFTNYLTGIFDLFNVHSNKVLVSGDMNVDLLKDNTNTENFINFFHSYHFLPKILKATRFSAQYEIQPSILDHFWTNSLVENPCGILTFDLLDHCPTFLFILNSIQSSNTEKIKLSFRPYNDEKLRNLIFLIDSFNWNDIISLDIDIYMQNFINKLNSLYQNCFPIKVKFVTSRSYNSPWITPEILSLIRYKNLFFKLYTDGFISKADNNRFKNKVKRIIDKSKMEYFKNSFSQAKNDIKQTWKLLGNLRGSTREQNAVTKIVKEGTEITDKNVIAEEFNCYFNNIANSALFDTSPNSINPLNYLIRNEYSFFLSPVSKEEICKIIMSLKNKKTDVNTCPIKILKQISPYISPIICKIVNVSFQTGQFPNCLKNALITPIHKNGNRNEISNYRPISILPTFSKIFEKCMLDRLWSFIRRFDLICTEQFGFIKNCSTEKAVLNLTEYFYGNLNKGFHSIAVLVDFKKALDSLDHNILLDKMECYGIRGIALNWFRNFLKDRSHAVKIENYISDYKILNIGIPQGSLISTVLFLFYINDLPKFSSIISSVLFADDTTLCLSGPNLNNLVSTFNLELKKFHIWTISNKLSINVSKTNCFLVSNRANHQITTPIIFNGHSLSFENSVKFLGVIIDSKLNFGEHIKSVKCRISKSIGILNNIKNLVPLEILRNLYFNLIYPYLNYCIVVWGGTNNSHLSQVINLQKRAIRVINKKSFFYHTNSLFIQSKILKFKDIYKFRVGDYFYTNDLRDFFSRAHTHDTRFHSSLLPDFQRLSSTLKSMSYAGPTIWNSIPEFIRESRSRNIFKGKLKNHILTSYHVYE